MAPSKQSLLNQEARLFARFAESYQRRLEALIDQGRGRRISNESAISICVEAMGMLVDSHARLTQVLADDRDAAPVLRRAA